MCTSSLVSPTSSVRSFVRGSWLAGTLLVVCQLSSESAGEQNHASGSGQPKEGRRGRKRSRRWEGNGEVREVIEVDSQSPSSIVALPPPPLPSLPESSS